MNSADDPLAGLPREATPPGSLKARVSATLRERGLIAPSGRARLGRAVGVAAAACAILAAGVLIGRETARRAAPVPDPRPQYVLLLYEDSSFAAGEAAERVAEYSAWADSLARQGLLVSAGKLADTGSVVLAHSGSELKVNAGDVASNAGKMAGFFIVRAGDETEATGIAGTIPHLRHGGRVALRPIELGQ
jgi:hypothetical protein